MPTTTTHGLRYPTLDDNANVPLYIQNLATDVEGKLPTVEGGQSVLAGTSPATDKSMIIKAYTINVATNSAGDATHSFPGGAFPNGVASIVLSSGDVVAGGHAFAAVHPTVTLSSVNTRHYQAGGAVCNGTGTGVTVRLNVIAVGW